MELTKSEWQIMNALWEVAPATARQISNRLPKEINWAYTTIKTILNRLVEKRVVKERKEGNTSIYEPILSRCKARRTALKSLANQAFDGAFGPLMHFLMEDQKLLPKQRQQLLYALQEEKTLKKGGTK